MNLLCKASDYLRRSRGLANSVTNGADMRLDLERKDVWNMKWADDNPELFAILEKTRHSPAACSPQLLCRVVERGLIARRVFPFQSQDADG